MAVLLTAREIQKQHGSRILFEGVSLAINDGEIHGLIGPNGAGKSTLMKVLAGLETPDLGEVALRKGVRMVYVAQDPTFPPGTTVGGVLEAAAHEPTQVPAILGQAGFTDATQDVDSLSGGWKKRLAIAESLLRQPDLLLLDEPTNHLDAESILWLEDFLREFPGAVIFVTHDRYFLDNVTGWILELDRGKGIPHEGNYSSFLEIQEKRLKQESSEEAAQKRTIAREREWIKQSPKARQAKSKARYQRYEELLKQASEKQSQTAQITIPVAERLGQNVVDFEGLSKAFGDRVLIDDLTFKLPPGGIVGVIGPNGAGKTTLFRMITKQETPDKGTITIGESVHLGYVDQSRDSLDGKKSVWEEISGGNELILLGKREVNSRGYCSSFNFKGADQQKKVGSLSGGERNRVHLAKMLKSGANVLLLDEPTNDLDIDTLRALEEALEDFAGCAVIISHDRWFLDRIATHILAFEGDGHVEWFEGNFQDYEKDKMRRLGQDSITPHRMKYKKLTR